MSKEQGRTYVLGETRLHALNWMRENDASARSRIITGPDSARGVMIGDEDRLVFVGDVESRLDWHDVVAMLTPCLVNVGGLAKVERVPGMRAAA